MEDWVDLGDWLHTEMVYLPAGNHHLSTNPSQRRVTSLIGWNASSLPHATTVDWMHLKRSENFALNALFLHTIFQNLLANATRHIPFRPYSKFLDPPLYRLGSRLWKWTSTSSTQTCPHQILIPRSCSCTLGAKHLTSLLVRLSVIPLLCLLCCTVAAFVWVLGP